MQDIQWISWENHRRTYEICNYFSIKLHIVQTQKKSIQRYLYLMLKTLSILMKNRTRVLIVQNPSIILTIFVLLLRFFFKYTLIVDAHNEAIQPYIHNNIIVNYISSQLIKYTDLTIVTNKYLADIVSSKGGKSFILPDKIPVIDEYSNITLESNKYNILLIATYSPDEPIKEVINAACNLTEKINLYVTGNYTKLDSSYIKQLPDNIIFTGFLSNKEYWGHVKAVDAIIDLTTMDNCLVCGAYEAVAATKPLVLSNNKASMEYFNKGVLFSDNTSNNLHNIFLTLIEKHTLLTKEVEELSKYLSENWNNTANKLMNKMIEY